MHIFLTEGGLKYGIGHLSRCEAIADAVVALGGECLFIVNADASAAQKLKYPHINCCWNTDDEALFNAIASVAGGVDGFFVDSYTVSQKTLERLSARSVAVFFIDDYQRIRYPNGVIINPELAAEEALYPYHPAIDVHCGIKYAPLHSCYRDFAPMEYTKRSGILVTFGGSDTAELLSNVAAALMAHDNVTIIKNRVSVADMQRMIAASRVIVCGGGGTLIEAARCGTPAVVVKIADNQSNNIKHWSAAGFAKFAGDKDNLDIRTVIAEIERLGDYDKWLKASNAGMSLVDGLGAERIAKLILSRSSITVMNHKLTRSYTIESVVFKHFLDMQQQEHIKMLESRNSDSVRNNSVSSRELSLKAQMNFVATLAKSTNAAYWKVSHSGADIGVVSLTAITRDDSATVGYYKLLECQTKGAGVLLLTSLSKLAKDIFGLQILNAECYIDNIASSKSLARAGYQKIDERTDDNGRAILVYQKRL